MPETLKVLSGVLIKFFSEGVEVGQAISHNRTSLGVETSGVVKIIDDASTDHRIQRHQRSFLMAGETGPPFHLVGFPER
jgi:hypothetical protein